jgi:hypothetical protein
MSWNRRVLNCASLVLATWTAACIPPTQVMFEGVRFETPDVSSHPPLPGWNNLLLPFTDWDRRAVLALAREHSIFPVAEVLNLSDGMGITYLIVKSVEHVDGNQVRWTQLRVCRADWPGCRDDLPRARRRWRPDRSVKIIRNWRMTLDGRPITFALGPDIPYDTARRILTALHDKTYRTRADVTIPDSDEDGFDLWHVESIMPWAGGSAYRLASGSRVVVVEVHDDGVDVIEFSTWST